MSAAAVTASLRHVTARIIQKHKHQLAQIKKPS